MPSSSMAVFQNSIHFFLIKPFIVFVAMSELVLDSSTIVAPQYFQSQQDKRTTKKIQMTERNEATLTRSSVFK